MNHHLVLESLYKLIPVQHWIQRREKTGPRPHRWLNPEPTFLFITEQSNKWSSKILYLKSKKYVYVSARLDKKKKSRDPNLVETLTHECK